MNSNEKKAQVAIVIADEIDEINSKKDKGGISSHLNLSKTHKKQPSKRCVWIGFENYQREGCKIF